MGIFGDDDLERIQREKQQQQEKASDARRRAEEQAQHQAGLLRFTIQGLREFPEAARKVGLPPTKRWTNTARSLRSSKSETYAWALAVWPEDLGGVDWLPTEGLSDDDIELLARRLMSLGRQEAGVRAVFEAALRGDPKHW